MMQFIETFFDGQFWTNFRSAVLGRLWISPLSLTLLISGIKEVIESFAFLEQFIWLLLADEPLGENTQFINNIAYL